MHPGDEILVSARHGDDRAGVIRDADGRLWMGHGRGSALHPITQLDGLAPAQIGGPGWMAVGGMLPAAGRTADVRDGDGTWQRAAIAGGAWVVFVVADRRNRPARVRLLDELGAVVSRAESSALATARRIGAPDAERFTRLGSSIGGLCPVCEAQDWRGTPSAAGLGEHLFCGVCGHTDAGVYGTWHPTATPSAEP